jgi:phosphatidylglycerophosphatase C
MTALPTATLAAFDLDHTLTRRDCVLPFLVRVAGWPRVLVAVLRNAPLLVWVAVGRGSRDAAKAAMVRGIFTGRDVAQVNALGEAFAKDTAQNWMLANTVERLRWHQAQGHTTALVSASLAPYVGPLGDLLGFHHVLCTEIAADGTGMQTGELVGQNCRGAEKVRRLEQCFPVRPTTVWAYGDSAGDREMLAWSDHAHLVRPGEPLITPPVVAA